MFILDVLEIPFEFIKENLTGWVIIILVILIIYFIGLRNYYLQKEKFYDQSMYEKNIKDLENAEKDILEEENKITPQLQSPKNKINKKISSKKASSKKISSSDLNTRNQIKESHLPEDGLNDKPKWGLQENSDARKKMQNINNIDYNFNQNNDSNDSSNKPNKKVATSRNTNTAKGKKVIEGFEPTVPSTMPLPNQKTATITNATPYIATTLFDNLNLTPAQVQSCKLKYNEIIAQYIVDLGKLSKMQSKNPYLNTSKEYDLIIAKGIDNIINYLNNNIKSYNVLTRTSIRTDIVNTLSSVLENLIDKTNNDLSNEMTTLASLNSTTIDYTMQLSSINALREQLEEYIAIDKLVSNYSHKINNSAKEIDSILDKSFILPIYERNFDKIKQLVNSDFNDDENNLANKYSKAYMDFLDEKKKEELDINPMRLASQIESGIVSFLSGLSGKTKQNQNQNQNQNQTQNIDKTLPEYGNSGDSYDYTNNSLREQYSRQYSRQYGYLGNVSDNIKNNPIPSQESKLLNETPLNASNIIQDPGNRGSYLINKKTQKDILEGFVTEATNPLSTSPNLTKAINNSSNSSNSTKNKQKSTDILSNLASSNFLQYIMDYIMDYTGDKLKMLFQLYNNKMSDGSNSSSYGNSNDINRNSFNLEENMIPAGFLLFILSMLFYFIDTTS